MTNLALLLALPLLQDAAGTADATTAPAADAGPSKGFSERSNGQFD